MLHAEARGFIDIWQLGRFARLLFHPFRFDKRVGVRFDHSEQVHMKANLQALQNTLIHDENFGSEARIALPSRDLNDFAVRDEDNVHVLLTELHMRSFACRHLHARRKQVHRATQNLHIGSD